MNKKKNKFLHALNKHKYIYVLGLASLLYIIIFKIVPLFGLQIAFKDYNFQDGIWGSEFVGFENFEFLFAQDGFWNAFSNTIIIGIMQLVFAFPVPIILAIIFSEIRNKRLRHTAQVVSTLPHFLSWVIIASLLFNFLGSYGTINGIIVAFGGEPISFFSDPELFRWMLILTNIWKESGWLSIIYYAAIMGIDKSLYEAAKIDGASRMQRIFRVTLPSIKNVIVAMFIIQVGGIFTAGFGQVFMLYNPTVYPTGDILETFIYRLTFVSGNNFDISAAASLFQGVLNALFLILAEVICKKVTGEGMFGELFFTDKDKKQKKPKTRKKNEKEQKDI